VYLLFIALPLIGIVMMYNRGSDWFAFGLRCRMRRKGILTWWIC
jgi:cytochrome b561